MSHECDIQLEGFDLDVWVSQWATGVNNTEKNINYIILRQQVMWKIPRTPLLSHISHKVDGGIVETGGSKKCSA